MRVANQDLEKDNKKLDLQNGEMRNIYRSRLLKYVQEGEKNYLNAREDLLRNYSEREVELLEKLDRFSVVVKNLNEEVRALRRYSLELKHLAEDWAPIGQPLPDILLQPAPIKLNFYEEKNYTNQDSSKIIRNLKDKNSRLEEEMLKMNKDFMKFGLNRKTLHRDSVNAKTLPRMQPVTANQDLVEENDMLKQAISDLKEKLKTLTLLARDHDNEGVIYLQRENENLKRKIEKLEKMAFSSENYPKENRISNVGSKVIYYEKIIQSLEIERSQLLFRAILAEEKWKKLQEQHQIMLRASKHKIQELKKTLKTN